MARNKATRAHVSKRKRDVMRDSIESVTTINEDEIKRSVDRLFAEFDAAIEGREAAHSFASDLTERHMAHGVCDIPCRVRVNQIQEQIGENLQQCNSVVCVENPYLSAHLWAEG